MLVALLVVTTGGTLAQERKATGEVGNIYRRPLSNDPATLDPARISDVYSRSVAEQLFDGLVQFDQTLTIAPALAQFWKSSRDGLSWTFTLKKGVKFHHGGEVTADDVVYSFTRILDPKLQIRGGGSLSSTSRVHRSLEKAGRTSASQVWPPSTATRCRSS